MDVAREEDMLGPEAAKPQPKLNSTIPTIHRAPSKAELRHPSEVGLADPTPGRTWNMMGIVVKKLVAATRGVTHKAYEKRARRSRLREERGSEQSGKCSPVGLESWRALGFREGAKLACKEVGASGGLAPG